MFPRYCVFSVLICITTDMVPWSSGVNKYVRLNFDARVAIYASQGEAVDLAIAQSTYG